MRKTTHDEFLKRVKKINPNVKILSKYINSKTQVKVKCKVCNFEWMAFPFNLLNGYGCTKCGRKKFAKIRTKTTEQFVNELKAISPNIKVLEKYTKNNVRMNVQCTVCNHKWNPLPYTLLRGYGCPKCAIKRRTKTHEQFIKELKAINSNIEPLEEYKGYKIKILFKCLKCGNEWKTVPQSLLEGHNCPKCAAKDYYIKHVKPHEQYVNEIKHINPNIEILGKYINRKSKIKVRCLKDGYTWEARANGLLRGYGCPKCSNTIRKTTQQFRAELKKVNPTVEITGKYVNAQTRIKAKCKVCGHEWNVTPRILLKKHICK